MWNNNASVAELRGVFRRLIVPLVSLDASKRTSLVNPETRTRMLHQCSLQDLVPDNLPVTSFSVFCWFWRLQHAEPVNSSRVSPIPPTGVHAARCLHFNYPTFHSAPLLVFASFSRRRNVPQQRLERFVWFQNNQKGGESASARRGYESVGYPTIRANNYPSVKVGLVLNLNWLFTIDTFECKTAAADRIAIVNRINFSNSAIFVIFF